VGEVLLRACHLEATDPGAIEKSWAGWVVHHVQAATSFRGEVDFQRWRSSALAALGPASPAGVGTAAGGSARAALPAGTAAAAEPAATTALRAHYALPPADPAAQARWEAALAEILPTVSPFELYGLEVSVPIASSDAELVVWVHPEDVIAANMLTRAVPRLEAALARAAATPGERVRVRLDRHRRAAGE
jgi:hypothetical protein